MAVPFTLPAWGRWSLCGIDLVSLRRSAQFDCLAMISTCELSLCSPNNVALRANLAKLPPVRFPAKLSSRQ